MNAKTNPQPQTPKPPAKPQARPATDKLKAERVELKLARLTG